MCTGRTIMPVDRGSSSSIRRIAVAGLQLEVWRAQASEKPHVEVRSSLYHHANEQRYHMPVFREAFFVPGV